ncbi:MAG: hypothetical protein HQ478_04265 [Chloroflexi bacterium]|nr:hypothetical protein [Chloroflexota bacterium]
MDPVIASHRGLDEFAPENTAPAFIAAWELGMAIEFDVQQSSDGELVVIHDATLDRTTDGTGAVADQSLNALKRLDAGSWRGPAYAGERILTLDETLALAAKHGRLSTTLVLEAKVEGPGVAEKICELLNKHSLMDRTIGIGTIMFSRDVRKQFRAIDHAFPAAIAINEPSELEAALTDEHSSWIYARFVPTPNQAEIIHGAGRRVIASGLNVMNIVDQAYASMMNGSDAVISNHPVDLLDRWQDHVRY